MAEKILETIIVLRTDTKEAWEADNSYKLREGEVGVGYMPITDDSGNVIKNATIIKIGAKDAKGELMSWKDLPQAEGVFEDDIVLTSDFGRHKISNGSVNAGGKGMTTSEWIIDALSEVKKPTVTAPSASFKSVTFTPSSGEAGTYITAVNYDGQSSKGSYQYGSNSNSAANSTTGVTLAWTVKNGEAVVGTAEDKTGISYESQMTDSEVALTLNGSVAVTAAAEGTYVPYTNIKTLAEDKKVASTTITFNGTAKVTGYRKPFWAVLDTPLDLTALTSATVRGLSGKGTATRGLPTTLEVAAGSRQVVFFAKAGAYSSLFATDSKAMNAEVSFTKTANAVEVEGANGYTAVKYDMWSVTWDGPIASAKSLVLAWA